MHLEQLVYLLPSRTVEDLSLDRGSDEAEELLSAWTALYHPALVARADTIPHFAPAEEPPEEPGASLIVVPPCCESYLPGDWVGRAETAGARLIRDIRRREDLVAAALKAVEADTTGLDAELVADFLALGYGQFLIEMLTRQLRYMSNLDEVSFRSATVAAAKAAVAGDQETARRELQQAFTLLHQSREYFYPVESHLLDLTLVAPTTIGRELRDELIGDRPLNLLMSGKVLAELAEREPETLAVLKARLEKGTLGLVGGEFDELPVPLLPIEAIGDQFERGLAVYQRHLGVRPAAFGRRRFGLSPLAPQVLVGHGFTGALHSTLDDGRFPTGNQSRIQWEGIDGTGIEAVGKVPLDIAQPQAFFRLPERLGSSMDIDHVATIVFAHWPGQSSTWYDDLRRIAGYTTAVGQFETVDTYFTATGTAGQSVQHKADGYRTPYLRQAIDAGQKDPLSRWASYYQARAKLAAAESMRLLALAAGGSGADGAAQEAKGCAAHVDEAVDAENPVFDSANAVESIETAFSNLKESLTGQGAAAGQLVVNPCSFTRRVRVDVSKLAQLPAVAEPIVAAGEHRKVKEVVVEVPAMGFAWVGPTAGQAAAPARRGWLFGRKEKPETPLAEDNVLQNEFFHVVIDRQFGGIRAVLDASSRGPRMAQQLGLRWPEGDEHDAGHESHYSIPAADEVKVTVAGPLVGEIVSRGRMMDRQGRRRASFTQTTRVARGSRLIEIEIELDDIEAPTGNPWQSYYAARFAWGDETTTLRRGVHGVGVATDTPMFEAPEFIELQASKIRTVILPGGLPYHRKVGFRRLDTLLVVPGETQRRFRLAIGVDCPSAAMAAIDFLTPSPVIAAAAPPATHGWLFHVEGRSVVATHWQPIIERGNDAGSVVNVDDAASVGLVGARVRLLETEGRSVRFGLRAPRPLASAAEVRPNGNKELPIKGDRAEIELRGYGWIEVELRFASG